MNKKNIIKNLLAATLIILNIGCDQFSKSVVRENVGFHEKIELFNENVILTKVENRGAFLGLGHALPPPVRLVLFLALPLAVMVVMLFMLFRKNLNKGSLIGLSFVIGGGLGNLYDRVIYGSVTDFLHIDLGFFKTGIFNMADLSIVIGVALLMFFNLIGEKKTAALE